MTRADIARKRSSAAFSALVGLCVVLVGCRPGPTKRDLARVRLADDYRRDSFVDDLKKIRSTQWPDRGFAAEAFIRVYNNVEWRGATREAVLRMLGPADGELAYREKPVTSQLDLEGELVEVQEVEKAPYVRSPSDDRLIYRTGDGHNHGAIYVFRFEEGKVSSVELGEGY